MDRGKGRHFPSTHGVVLSLLLHRARTFKKVGTDNCSMQDVDSDEPMTTYATPDSVAQTLGLSDPSDPMSVLKFSDSSSPSYDFVCDLILAAEDELDRRLNRSYRVNHVKDYITTISGYQADEGSIGRPWYYNSGGYEITLRRNLLPWDTSKGDRL